MSSADERRRILEEKKARLAAIRRRRANLQAKNRQMASLRDRDEKKTRTLLNYVKDLPTASEQAAYKPPNMATATHSAAPMIVSAGTAGPSREISLMMVEPQTINIFPKEVEKYDKGAQVTCNDIALQCEFVNEETSMQQERRVVYEFGGGKCDAWPPKGGGGFVGEPANDGEERVINAGPRAEITRDEKPKISAEELKTMTKEEIMLVAPELVIDYEPDVMDAKTYNRVVETSDFQSFWSNASLFMERALSANERFDPFIDYTAEILNEIDNSGQNYLSKDPVTIFRDSKTSQDRPITSLAWSEKNKHLFLSAYAEPEGRVAYDQPDGTVNIWSLALPSRPEFTFTCQSMVTTAQFHPANAQLITGVTLSGQLVVWDMRTKKATPVQRSSFSGGHSHAIFAMQILPSQSRQKHILSISNDAKLCVWRDELISEPAYECQMILDDETTTSRDDMTASCLTFPPKEQSKLMVGSDEGSIYQATIYSNDDADKGKQTVRSLRDKHSGPVTQLDYHPANKGWSQDIQNLFLSSSYDWTAKLWDGGLGRCIKTFDTAQDYIHDIQWSPVQPAVFGMVDGTGTLQIFDLSKNMDVPRVNKVVTGGGGAVSRLSWSTDGKQLLIADSNGDVRMYDVKKELYESEEDTCSSLIGRIRKLGADLGK